MATNKQPDNPKPTFGNDYSLLGLLRYLEKLGIVKLVKPKR